jgi:hypothetical protein
MELCLTAKAGREQRSDAPCREAGSTRRKAENVEEQPQEEVKKQ